MTANHDEERISYRWLKALPGESQSSKVSSSETVAFTTNNGKEMTTFSVKSYI